MDRIADYTFVRLLGQGNHGHYYLAPPPERLGLDAEHVAVKIIGGSVAGDGFRRATKELKIFASVRSPYLVTLYDAGQDGSSFFYSMEYFPLGSLATPARPLTRPEVLRAVAHGARAAHALHEAGVVHRDIKPGNLLLHDDGAKLSDLGLAQILSPGQTTTGMGSVGSLEFMDPRIIAGDRASRTSDIWALGVTLHRALSGAGLYGELPDNDPILALHRMLKTEPKVSTTLEAGDADVVIACLMPEPLHRPATALALAERIEALLEAS